MECTGDTDNADWMSATDGSTNSATAILRNTPVSVSDCFLTIFKRARDGQENRTKLNYTTAHDDGGYQECVEASVSAAQFPKAPREESVNNEHNV